MVGGVEVVHLFVIASEAKQSMDRNRHFQPAVYMMANHKNGTIYTGVTSDLPRRAWEHREGVAKGFTSEHGCKRLVWFELHSTMEYAITREKQIKGGSRAKKIALIEDGNPEWRDLFLDLRP
jgi:putative endonuclease